MATIATLIVKLGADIADLKTGVDAAGNKIDSFAGKASRAFDALKGAAAFGAVAAMVATVASAIDEIDGISAKIGDTAENVQRLQAVSESFDVEMTAIVGAIQEMEKGLASGKIEGALAAINISVADFQSMSPSQRYVEVAEALAKVHDRSMQVTLAQELFGKKWKENIAAIREGVSEADRWIKINNDTVESLDRAGISWGNAKAAVIAVTAGVIQNILQLNLLFTAYDNVRDSVNRLFLTEKNYAEWKKGQYAKEFVGLLPDSPIGPPKAAAMPSKAMLDEQAASTKILIKDAGDYREKLAKAREETERHNLAFRESVSLMGGAAGNWRMWQQFAVGAIDSATSAAFEFEQAFRGILTAMDLSARGWEPFKQGITDSGAELDKLHARLKSVSTWKSVGAGLSSAVLGALQGGGDVGRALGGSAGQMLGTKLGTKVGDWAGKAIGGALGSAIGGAAGSVLPVVGTMLGAAAGGLIGKLFGGGGSKERKEIQTAMQSLDFATLRAKADELGISMDRVFSAKKVDDFKNALAGVSAQIDEQEKLHQRGIAAMERYGITIEEAGVKFKQTQMNATAQSLVEDFHALVAIGVDTDTIIQKMGSSIGEFVHRSIEMGTQVPREMEPIIRKMIETGSLVDRNGEKFTDLGQIPWAENPSAAMQKLIDKISALIDLISDGIPDALNKLPKTTEVGVKVKVDTSEYDDWRRDVRTVADAAFPESSGPSASFGTRAVMAAAAFAPARAGQETHVHIHDGVFDGYTSEVTFARKVLDVLSQERERRGRSLAFGSA